MENFDKNIFSIKNCYQSILLIRSNVKNLFYECFKPCFKIFLSFRPAWVIFYTGHAFKAKYTKNVNIQEFVYVMQRNIYMTMPVFRNSKHQKSYSS